MTTDSTIVDKVLRKLDRLRHEFTRSDLDRLARALHLAELALKATGQAAVRLGNERIYELNAAPKQMRGLRDLTVRVAGLGDLPALTALNGTPATLIKERFARGDFAFIGELDGRLLAHAWFHRGPEPFCEDQPLFPRWEIPNDAFWSYHAYTLPETRRSGVFVKVFQTALQELLDERGAKRVRCMINAANAASIALHERFGFRPLGDVLALSVPGSRLVTWHGDGMTRRWLQRHDRSASLLLPPT